ncbi:Glycerophosphodiester transporter GIT2 [Hyphodiscus hymeniophilus]|uniref:Glycerophosphodiester transporter GIT2 n=1 Tax=Hyphodiscus hymeniophilus TaxID=353542 RepID=A0A9P6VKD5_9HELO|nr:Glycerophosphodiester transporter GIT2 [Hyphodiscus hymeniophilus]
MMEKDNTYSPGEVQSDDYVDRNDVSVAELPTSFWSRIWPVFACGAGLFSDGYLQSVIGSATTILETIYGDAFSNSNARRNIVSLTFVGTVVGQIGFGFLSDYWSRKNSLLVSTTIMIIFAALSAGAYGGGTLDGMVAALTAYRVLVGIGIGGEYPAGSVAASEATAELKAGTRNRWFIFATNFQLDIGFVAGTLVPMIVVLATTQKHLRAAWRISLGIGAVLPICMLIMRTKLKEPVEYRRNKMNKYPYLLIIRYYWFRLLTVSVIWFIYDMLTYSFSLYSSAWLDLILNPSGNATTPLWIILGWSTLINAFYCPGSFIGAFISDWIGPKYSLIVGVTLQGTIGFIMTGIYKYLDTNAHVAGFVVIYGIFLALGEIGPGNNIGLIASKTSSTSVRGQYYGIAAAFGKLGGFAGNYIFPYLIADGGSSTIRQGQIPFYFSSGMCFLSAIIAITCLPKIDQNFIEEEDNKFKAYLESKGYDTSTMGTTEHLQALVE